MGSRQTTFRKGAKLSVKLSVEAIEYLSKNPNYPKASYNLGNAIYQQNRNKEAVAQFELVEKTVPDKMSKAEAYHNMGNSFMKEKEYDKAVAAYKNSMRNNSKDEETLKLAKIFGSPYIVYSKNLEKTFRKSMANLGKKVVLFEGGKSLNLDKTVTRVGIQGAVNVIHFLGMRDFSSKISKATAENPPIIIKSSKWIRAKRSGMYRSYINVGQKVEKGVKLGSISDPFGDYETVFKNPQEGYVLNSNHSPIVNQGDAILHIGFE